MLVHKLNLSLTTPFALYEASSTEANGEQFLAEVHCRVIAH